MSHQFITRQIHIAVDLMREYGMQRFVMDILPWLFNRSYSFYKQPIQNESLDTLCRVPFSLRLVQKSDLDNIVSLRPRFYCLSSLRERLENGHLGFLACFEKKPIHIRWGFVHSFQIPYLNRTLTLESHDIYIDEAYTTPAYRRMGVYSHAGYLMRQILRQLDYRRLVCAFPSWDIPGQKVAARNGLKKIGEGGYRSFFGHRSFFWNGKIQERSNGNIFLETKEPI